MSLSIKISDPQPFYSPGDQIEGSLIFTPNGKATPAQHVLVSLKHISKCRFGLVELETLYSADIVLNQQTIELIESPTTLQSVQEWPFKFIFQESTGYLESPFRQPSRLYNDASDQTLPPSFSPSRKETPSLEDNNKIDVGIYAEIISEKVKSNLFKRDTIEAVSLLHFMPERRNVSVNWNMSTKQESFEARTPLLAEVSGNRGRSLSIKEKMLKTIKSTSLPAAAFDVLISMPRAAVVGQPIPLFLGLQHDQTRNEAQDEPQVIIKSLTVKLETITSLRGLSESKSIFRAEELPASHYSWTRTQELARLSNSIELTEIVDLREHLQLKIPTETIQSFSTFNMARTYNLQVLVTVECAKQKFSTSFDLYPVQLLAAHKYDEVSPPGIALGVSAATRKDSLPTWEESGGYGEHGIPGEKEELPPSYA